MSGHGQAVNLKDEDTGVRAIITSKGLKVDTEMTVTGDFKIDNITVAQNDARTEEKRQKLW